MVPIVLIRLADEDAARYLVALELATRVAAELEPLGGPGSPGGRPRPAYRCVGVGPRTASDPDAVNLLHPGPPRLHPSACGVLVGARMPLVAFNVNLRTRDLDIAREIASLIRERDGGLPECVRSASSCRRRGWFKSA